MPGKIDSAPKKRGGAGVDSQKSGWSARAWVEIALMILGLAPLAAFCGAQIDSYLNSRAALKEFSKQRSAAVFDSAQGTTARTERAISGAVEPSLGGGSLETSDEHRQDKQFVKPGPLAVLRIPKIQLVVPVITGTDAVTLNRGVGWIEGTATPGQSGNVGIAGHRDSFFLRP